MTPQSNARPTHPAPGRLDGTSGLPPPPGQMPLITTGLAIGILLMGIQLWLLTVALDLYLAGKGSQVWQLALISGAIFLGGLVMLRLVRRRPRVSRATIGEPELSRHE